MGQKIFFEGQIYDRKLELKISLYVYDGKWQIKGGDQMKTI